MIIKNVFRLRGVSIPQNVSVGCKSISPHSRPTQGPQFRTYDLRFENDSVGRVYPSRVKENSMV